MMLAKVGPRGPVPKYGQRVAPNLNVRQICPNCRNDPPNIIEEYSKGDLVCGDCGTILGDRIVDTRSEWRTFAGDEGGDDPSRVGDAGNPLLSNLLETSISSQDGRSGMARDLQRAQARVNSLSTGATNLATLSSAFARIAEKCEAMQLPRTVVQRAQHIYKIAFEKRVIKARNEKAVIAACITFAGRDVGAERSFPEICRATGVHKKELGQAVSQVKLALTEERLASGKALAGLSSVEKSAEGLIRRFVNYLDLGNTIYNAAKHVVVEATAKAQIEGKNPVSIAGGALYFTCVLFEKPVSAKDIQNVANVTDNTIKLVCKFIAKKIDAVIRPEWKTAHPAGYANLVALTVESSARPSRATTPRPEGTPRPDDLPSSKAPSPKPEESKPDEAKGVVNGHSTGNGMVANGSNGVNATEGVNGVNGHGERQNGDPGPVANGNGL